MRGLWNKAVNVSGKYVLYLIPVLIVLLVASLSTFGAAANSRGLILTSLNVLPESVIQVLILVFFSLVVICAVVIFFSLKLKRINKKLLSRNNEIEKVNLDLKRSSEELAAQKELIARQYSESDKFYKILFQSADDGVSFYDSDGNLKYANPAYYSIIGYDKESYSSLNFADIIHPEDRDYRETLFNELNNKGIYESELRLKHKEGHFVNISSKSVQVKDDSGIVLGALTISRDISKLKRINEELVKANVEAETSSRLKSSFLANISHEIRTPLNSVVGFSNLLLANDITQEVKEEYVEQINHNSEKLLQIIGDIIDLSRLESSQIEITYEEASINEIVGEVIEESRQIIRRNEKPIILNVKNQFEDNADIVFTDKIWLKRVLTHLMDNAIKFTLDGSIEFSYYKENGNLVFSIKDTGIGINKENLLRIFEEFRQEIDGHHRPFEGLGIGLTLAKEVIERMGGTIDVKSEKGMGSEFSFSIPYRPAGSTRTRLKDIIKDPSARAIDWSSKKCLIVDDNKDVLVYLNRTLMDTGVSIITARSGIEAIDIIKNTPDIDVVLLDMQMPEMNGIEATKEIRMIRKNLPIIAQTAFIFEDDKDIILEAGCDACLIKPIRREHLITVMASFIRSNQ